MHPQYPDLLFGAFVLSLSGSLTFINMQYQVLLSLDVISMILSGEEIRNSCKTVAKVRYLMDYVAFSDRSSI